MNQYHEAARLRQQFRKNNTKNYVCAENRMFVSTNIRILSSLSITRFVYKRLNIILAGYAQCISGPGKGGLCVWGMLMCYKVAHKNLTDSSPTISKLLLLEDTFAIIRNRSEPHEK